MKLTLNPTALSRAALVAVGLLVAPAAFAVGQATTYAPGDLFIGFRQSGVTNTLSVSIGGVAKYIPVALGGTWDGNPFQVQFGLIPTGNPGAGTPVFSLAPDLAAVFTSNWAANPAAQDGSGVRWSIAGITSTVANNDPISGFGQSTIFLSKAETTSGVQSATLGSLNTTAFQGNFTSFTSGIGGGSYTGAISTSNSSKAYIGSGEDANNWGKRIGSAGDSWASGRLAEQAQNGPFSGPTDSILDLYVRAGSGSTTVAAASRTYLGSFDLASDGTLIYGPVPEPGSAALLGLGATLLGMTRPRKRARSEHPTAPLT